MRLQEFRCGKVDEGSAIDVTGFLELYKELATRPEIYHLLIRLVCSFTTCFYSSVLVFRERFDVHTQIFAFADMLTKNTSQSMT